MTQKGKKIKASASILNLMISLNAVLSVSESKALPKCTVMKFDEGLSVLKGYESARKCVTDFQKFKNHQKTSYIVLADKLLMGQSKEGFKLKEKSHTPLDKH